MVISCKFSWGIQVGRLHYKDVTWLKGVAKLTFHKDKSLWWKSFVSVEINVCTLYCQQC